MTRRRTRGFTLMELMVVLVIIGICSAGIGLGMGSLLDPQRQLRQDAFKLAQALQVARDACRIDGVPMRWVGDGEGYAFERHDGVNWKEVTTDPQLARQKWNAGNVAVMPRQGVELSPEWIGSPWDIALRAGQQRLHLHDDGTGTIQVQP